MTRQTIICMKWGKRYGADFANRLASMVRRNTRRATRLICFTDDRTGVDPGIELAPLPPIDLPERVRWLPWRKISLWQHPLLDLEGDVSSSISTSSLRARSMTSSISNPAATAWRKTGRSPS
jgi:hypothetical protein